MFHIFHKKRFLIDYLRNFVDIHNHILPGIDDGAKNPEESLELIRGFQDFGVHRFIATPHIMHHYYPNNKKTIETSLIALKDELLKQDLTDVTIEASAEHMIDENFEEILKNSEVMPMRRNYLLVEMSYLQPSINFDHAIQGIGSQRFFPILAHPERYGYFHQKFKTYSDFKNQGILFQLNLLSLGDFYGKEVQKISKKLLENDLIDFVASDVHNIHQLNELKELRVDDSILKLLLPIIENTIDTFY